MPNAENSVEILDNSSVSSRRNGNPIAPRWNAAVLFEI